MTARRPRLSRIIQLSLAVLAGLVVGLVWLAGSEEDAVSRPSEAVEVTADITPDVHVFGQPVVATVEVLVDATEVDPQSVRVLADFEPYELAGERTVERSVSRGVGRVIFRFPLRCLEEGCDTSSARGVAQLEAGRVVYRFRGGSGDAFKALGWPSFEVASRVSADDVERIRWRAAETFLPAVVYRIDPTVLAALLLALAAALGLGAAALAQRLWREQPDEALLQQAVPSATRLERALALARDASLNGDVPRRRRALERVARELVAVDRPELAAEARRLAWAPNGSTERDVEDLARRAEGDSP